LKTCREHLSWADLYNLRCLGDLARRQVDNLGEIKRSGNSIIDSKIDVTTPAANVCNDCDRRTTLLMKVPSRMVVMENLPPLYPGELRSKPPAVSTREQ